MKFCGKLGYRDARYEGDIVLLAAILRRIGVFTDDESYSQTR